MPRYFFHRTDSGFSPDTEGTDLPDIGAARTEAVRYAGATMQECPNDVWDGRDLRVEVTDDGGRLLCTVVVIGIDGEAAQEAPSRPRWWAGGQAWA